MAAKIDVRIRFDGEVPEAFDDENSLEKALIEFHGDKEANGVEVYELEQHGVQDIYLTLHSHKQANALWQQDLLLAYLKKECAGNVTDFETVVWVNIEDYDYFLTEDDF